jgi:hypothetical protein
VTRAVALAAAILLSACNGSLLGDWTFDWGVASVTCDDGYTPPLHFPKVLTIRPTSRWVHEVALVPGCPIYVYSDGRHAEPTGPSFCGDLDVSQLELRLHEDRAMTMTYTLTTPTCIERAAALTYMP